MQDELLRLHTTEELWFNTANEGLFMTFRLRLHKLFMGSSGSRKRSFSSANRIGATMVTMLVILTWPVAASHAQTSPSSGNENTRQAHVFRLLFRQALAYERLASEADTAGAPKPYFRRILSIRLELNETDSANLLRMAQCYQTAVAPVRQAIMGEKAALRADFPLGLKPKGMSVRSHSALDDLHEKEDGVALVYRDLLQNAMGPDAFQRMATRLYASFGQIQPEKPK